MSYYFTPISIEMYLLSSKYTEKNLTLILAFWDTSALFWILANSIGNS